MDKYTENILYEICDKLQLQATNEAVKKNAERLSAARKAGTLAVRL